ncbi:MULTISPECIES: MFS transporter [Halomonadaceae]|uniref:MFS transporter n=2 Tax=Halomonadaceae TaxID=28256 RepID=A0ABS6ZQG7_9GAMM|nr:MFS transporter [Halomonas sulfidivorans]MBW6392309.1 MFS transporter [Halomonas antri]QTP58590.1 MFS transporter [Halomonas sulfidivorans]
MPLIVLLATTLVLAFSSLVALFPAAIAPELAAALGVSSATVGLQVSLIFAGAMLSSMIGGPLTRRLGPCRTSQLSLGLLGSAAALLAIPSLPLFALASLIAGLGYGMTNPSASVLLVRFTPAEHRGLIFSLKQAGVPLGGVLAGASAPALALTAGWQAGLLTLTGLAAGGILALQRTRQEWDDQREPRTQLLVTPFAGLLLVWRQRALRHVALLSLCFSAIQLSVSAFTVALLVEDLAFGLVQAGLVMSAVQISGVAGRIGWGWVGDRLGDRLNTLAIIACTTAAGALLVAVMTPAWPQWLVAALLCLLSLSSLGWNGVFMAEITHLAPPERIADAAGGCLVFTYSGVLLGLPLVTLLHGLVGRYTPLFALLGGISLLGLWLIRQARRALILRTADAA